MPLVTGTHTIADLAANTFANDLVVENIDALNDAIRRDLEMHNARVRDMVSDLCEVSTERSTVYGTNARGEAVPVDEFGRAPTQKITLGSKVEFPLDKFEFPIGWTADYLRRATVQDMARKTIAARTAHVRRIQFDVKRALFGPTNFTWRDRRVDNLDLAVKRLVNADSAPIPNGQDGAEFNAATHTHYDAIDWGAANAAARIAAVQALVQDVVEHEHGADLRIYISSAQETDFRALTPNFTPLPPPNITEAENTRRVTGQSLDVTRANNRMIGYFDGIPVFTKPWVPANYIFAFAAGDESKTLRMRISTLPSEQGLYIGGEIITHPLQAQYMNFVHGFGVIGRTNGAILYLGAGTYAEPTFTL